MKCKICGHRAVIKMPHHNMAMCGEHFNAWVPKQVERTIKLHSMFSKEDKILVAVSGGKDSLALWDILLKAGYQAEGLYIQLGIDAGDKYSEESRTFAQRFADSRDVILHVVNLEHDHQTNINELSKLTQSGRTKPCQVCGLVKRHEMNRIAKELSFDVLATGHNLDDEAATLLSNTLRWTGQYLKRQSPVLPANKDGLVKKVKPLVRVYEREVTAYCLINQIDYILDECPYADGARSILLKQVLNQMESASPGTKFAFYHEFLKAKKRGLFSSDIDKQEYTLEPCWNCGQPTSAGGFCAFCRLLEKQSQIG